MASITVGIAADPGLPLRLSHRLRDQVLQGMRSSEDGDAEWNIEVEELSLPLDADGTVELTANSQLVRDDRGWDYIVYLTDLPKYINGEPLVSMVNTGYGSAMVVLPSLGLVRARTVASMVAKCLRELRQPELEETGPSGLPHPVQRVFTMDDDLEDPMSHHAFETAKGPWGRLAMQAGMVRSNRPFRLVPKLSSAMAAASATGAFGIFYTNIWSMADYLSTPRLLAIAALSIAVMTAWLITSHGLFERPQGARQAERRVTYNMATLLTVLLAVGTMFAFLFVLIFIGAVVVINIDYMTEQLGHDVGLPEYLNLAWLSASMGIIAGAVGSSLSDADAVRKATFSSREYLRRQIVLEPREAADAARQQAGEAAEAADAADAAADDAAQEAQNTAQAAEAADAAARQADPDGGSDATGDAADGDANEAGSRRAAGSRPGD